MTELYSISKSFCVLTMVFISTGSEKCRYVHRGRCHTDTCYIMSKSQVKMLVHVMGINESGIRADTVEFSEKGASGTIYTQYSA